METKNSTIFMAVHPGFVLKEELLARGIRQNSFAAQIGMQTSHLSELLNGKRKMSADIACNIESSLGIPAKFWMSMQGSYDVDCKVIAQRQSPTTTLERSPKNTSAPNTQKNHRYPIGYSNGYSLSAKGVN